MHWYVSRSHSESATKTTTRSQTGQRPSRPWPPASRRPCVPKDRSRTIRRTAWPAAREPSAAVEESPGPLIALNVKVVA